MLTAVFISSFLNCLFIFALSFSFLERSTHSHPETSTIEEVTSVHLFLSPLPYKTKTKKQKIAQFLVRLFVFLFSSVQFSCSVMSNSLQTHELQHTRPPCSSPTPGVYPNSWHWVGDANQPSHPLLSPSPPALNLSQHQGLFKRVSSSLQVAKVLEFQLQHQSLQWILRTNFL